MKPHAKESHTSLYSRTHESLDRFIEGYRKLKSLEGMVVAVLLNKLPTSEIEAIQQQNAEYALNPIVNFIKGINYLHKPTVSIEDCRESMKAFDIVLTSDKEVLTQVNLQTIADSYCDIAHKFVQFKCYHEARSAYKRTLQCDDTITAAKLKLIWISEMLNEPEALDLAREYAKSSPSVVSYTLLSSILVKRSQYEEATICCNLSIDIDPKTHLIHTIKGNALYGLDRYAEALQSFQQAIQLGAKSPDIFKNTIACANALENNKLVIELWTKNKQILLEDDKSDTEVSSSLLHLYVGIAYFQQQKYADAIKVLNTSLNTYQSQEGSSIEKIYFFLGISQHHQQEHKAAIKI